MNLIRHACLTTVLISGLHTHAQEAVSPARAKTKAETQLATAEAPILQNASVEQIEGVTGVAAFYGKKLLKDLSSKMGIEAQSEPATRKKIVMKVGPFRIERYEDG